MSSTGGPPIVYLLLVEDNQGDVRMVQEAMREAGLAIELAVVHEGNQALSLIEAEPHRLPDLVLSDLRMPGMSGLELVVALRKRYPTVPVILMTAFGNEDIALQALRRGAASYVPKNNLIQDLPGTLTQVLEAAQSRRHEEKVLSSMVVGEERFELENDISLISPLITHIQERLSSLRFCDETGRIQITVTLREAIHHAMHHGNLEIDWRLREENEARYLQMIEERQRLTPFMDRKVWLRACYSQERVQFQIVGEGRGLDFTQVPDPTEVANYEKMTGRGLLLLRTFMDEVTVSGDGKEILLTKNRENPAVDACG
jgi:CheY-like chemotaxis protein